MGFMQNAIFQVLSVCHISTWLMWLYEQQCMYAKRAVSCVSYGVKMR